MHNRPAIPDNVPYLMPMHGSGDRRPRVLDGDVATVGRARGSDLCLDASDVSTIHCLVFRGPRGYYVRDCNSRTGTRVNGHEIRGQRPLIDGDILQVGPFSFEVHLPRRPAAAAPVDAAQLQRREDSRRRFAAHALRYRRLLHEHVGANPQTELARELARVTEKSKLYERRLQQLNEAEREFETEQERFRVHVQRSELAMAHRLEEAEQQVRARWQEFQRRCQAEESDKTNGQAQALAELEHQQAALAQQESALRGQRAELSRMLTELRSLQEELHRPVQAKLDALTAENEQLRKTAAELESRVKQNGGAAPSANALKEADAENELLRVLLQDRERELNEALEQLTQAPKPSPAEGVPAELAALRSENEILKEQLAQTECVVEELRLKSSPQPARSAGELESYEAELNQERQQLERERAKLNADLEQMRLRNEELDEAIREMEMQMSRERAEMGRERMRVERMRDDLRADLEKTQREMSVRESLAPVNRLRDEINQKKGTGKVDPAADRLRQLRTSNDTPRGQ